MNKTKTCAKCGIEQDVAGFYKDKRGKDGRKASCKECVKSRRRNYRKENLEKVKAQEKKCRDGRKPEQLACNKTWRKSNPLKYKISMGRKRARNIYPDAQVDTFSSEELLEYWASAGIDPDNCFYCKIEPFEELEHYISFARGGDHTKENLRPSCHQCNVSKQCKPPGIFLQEIQSGFEEMWCECCMTIKPRDDFYNASKAPTGKQASCKACQSAAMADWYKRKKFGQ